jgi:2-amino-4-hydroxy-6-hydroxymethyldihydropteridine diphosphokinase
MNVAFLCLGGNIHDRLAYLKEAERRISESCGRILDRSKVYKTQSWGKEGLPDFYNKVIKVETELNAEVLLARLLSIEMELGRTRGHDRNESRTMDIDILLYNDELINFEHCHIPHPRMHLRKFVLVPLNDIASEWIHPVFKKPIKTLLEECIDTLEVSPVEG